MLEGEGSDLACLTGHTQGLLYPGLMLERHDPGQASGTIPGAAWTERRMRRRAHAGGHVVHDLADPRRRLVAAGPRTPQASRPAALSVATPSRVILVPSDRPSTVPEPMAASVGSPA